MSVSQEYKNIFQSLQAQVPEKFSAEDLAPEKLGSAHKFYSYALDISGNCNLNCKYCAENETQPSGRKSMTLETLHSIWSFIHPDGKPRKGISLHFGSGEPLLSFLLLQELDRLIKEKYEDSGIKKPVVYITTNGTLLTKKRMDWLADTGWHIKISFDGPRNIQDKWRVFKNGTGTYYAIVDNINTLAMAIPERFSVTSVLSRGTKPMEVFDFISSLGVKQIELVPIVHNNDEMLLNSSDIDAFESFLKTYTNRIIESSKKQPRLIRFINRVRRVMGYDNNYVQCGAGRNFMGIDAHGEIFPCFRFIGMNDYKLGNINSDANMQLVSEFAEGAGCAYNNRPVCSKCWAAPLCGGPCFAVNETFADEHEPFLLHCIYALLESKYATELVVKLQDKNPEKLLDFLPNIPTFDVEHYPG